MAPGVKDEVLKLLDIEEFKEVVLQIQKTTAVAARAALVGHLLTLPGLTVHYDCGDPKTRVLSDFKEFEHNHERLTACKLADHGYNVLFAPKGMFTRFGKRFDVYLCKGHILLQADLKSLTTKNPDTIGQRIKGGSNQASRVVLDITSDITARVLIDGLKLGCKRNDTLVQIILCYKNKCQVLTKEQILSKKIFDLVK